MTAATRPLRTPLDAPAAARVHPAISHLFAVNARLRVDIDRAAVAVETATAADRAGRLRPLAAWAAGVARAVRLHDEILDHYVFPALAAGEPGLGGRLRPLQLDHLVVADLLDRWVPALQRLADDRVPFAAAHAEAHASTGDLRAVLAVHLAAEDRELLSRLTGLWSTDDIEAVAARVWRAVPKAGLGFTVSWNVTAHAPAAQAELLAAAPMGLRLLHRLDAGRFRRLVDGAFAGVAAATPR